MRLATIDSLICLAVWAEAALDSLDQPEGKSSLPLSGMTADRAFHAALSHLTVPQADRGFFHFHLEFGISSLFYPLIWFHR